MMQTWWVHTCALDTPEEMEGAAGYVPVLKREDVVKWLEEWLGKERRQIDLVEGPELLQQLLTALPEARHE